MSWNPFAAGGLLGGSSRPPRPGMINNRRNRKAKLSKHASAQISQFQHGGITSGKFVLDEEDLKIMGVQSKLDITKRETMTQKANQHDELEILNIVKQNMKLAIEERMEEVVENPTYLEYYRMQSKWSSSLMGFQFIIKATTVMKMVGMDNLRRQS